MSEEVNTRVALLLSCHTFENYYGEILGLSTGEYVERYRNDWAWSYCSRLRELGITPFIYVPTRDRDGLCLTEDGYRVRFLRLRPIGRGLDRARRLFRTPVGRYALEAGNALALLQGLRRAVATDELDILYVQEYWTARFDVLAWRGRPPLIAADHGGWSQRSLTLTKSMTLPRAHAITCQTRQELARLKAYSAPAIHLAGGIDTEFFTPDPKPRKVGPRVLTVCRLTDDVKRVSDLIQAMRFLDSTWRLEIAGTGPDEANLRSLAKSCGVEQSVRFLGFVFDRLALRELYRGAGVFAIASASEALGAALVEAMSCACPVVAPDTTVFPEVVRREHGGVLTARGPKGLAAGIVEAFQRRKELGPLARQFACTDFSLDRQMGRLADVIRESAAAR